MLTPLRPKQQRFVNEYVVDFNAKQAAIRAGYSPRSAETNGNRMLRNAQVADAVDAAKADQQARSKLTADDIIEELRKIAFHDPRKAFAADGSLKAIHELDDETAAGVVSLEVRIGSGDDGEVIKTARIKFADKRSALVDLGRHFGIFDPKRQPGAENPFNMLVDRVQGHSFPIVQNPPSFDDDDD